MTSKGLKRMIDSTGNIKVTLIADEWLSSKGGLSTINRELAIQLAKFPSLEVSLFMAKCSEKERELANKEKVKVFEANQASEKDPNKWWNSPPPNFATDFIIGHSSILGKQAKDVREHFQCKWVQVVHTDPEELGSFKNYSGANATGEEKFKKEVELCKLADLIVGIGPKLAEVYSAKLRKYRKNVFSLTPSIFHEFSEGEQAPRDGKIFRVLIFGRGDTEDISLKGFDLAAQAVAHLGDESYHLVFVGVREGDHDEVRKRLLQVEHGVLQSYQLKVRKYITRREELVESLYEADLAIMPSRTEGFGLTALEALSVGLPILVGKNTGFAEAMKDVYGGESCTVDSYEADDWANRIKKVREMPRQKRLNHCKRLCEEYKKVYSWEKQCESLVKEMLALNDDPEEVKEGPASSKRQRVASPEIGHAESDGEGKNECDDDSDDSCELEDNKDNDTSKKMVEKENKNDLFKSRQKPSSSQASASVPCPPEEASQITFKEGKPSDLELDELAGKIGQKWEKLGIHLDISYDVLDEIAANALDKPQQMLRRWRDTTTSAAPYRELYNALCHSRVGLNNLAKEFCCKATT